MTTTDSETFKDKTEAELKILNEKRLPGHPLKKPLIEEMQRRQRERDEEIQNTQNKILSRTTPLRTEKEKEQKFGILVSPKQERVDFASYFSEPGAEANIGVVFLDIDDFKGFNKRFTETAVDRCLLPPFQQLLRAACMHRGEAYRHGGEEFLVLLPNHTREEIECFAERLRRQVETHEFSVDGEPAQITVSIGIALWPEHGDGFDDLIARANEAEHEAKAGGGNRVAFARRRAS